MCVVRWRVGCGECSSDVTMLGDGIFASLQIFTGIFFLRWLILSRLSFLFGVSSNPPLVLVMELVSVLWLTCGGGLMAVLCADVVALFTYQSIFGVIGLKRWFVSSLLRMVFCLLEFSYDGRRSRVPLFL